MLRTIQVQPVRMDIEESRTVKVFQKTFRPILLVMKLSGLCPKALHLSKPGGNRRQTILSTLYSTAVVLMIIFNIARTAPYLNITSSFTLYLRLNVIVWYIRCLAFSLYLFRIASSGNERRSMLESIIKRLDEDIEHAQLKSNGKALRKFTTGTKILFWCICTMIAFSWLFVVIAIAAKLGSGAIDSTLLHPFQNSLIFKIIYNFCNIHLVIIWLTPALLYSTMCSSLVMKLSFLESSLASLNEHSTLLQQQIKTIRSMFLNVTSIVSKADEAFGPVALFIYFFDIVLFSVTLYGSLFIAKSPIEHTNLWFWCFASALNLLLVSVFASRVEEKVGLV